MVQPKGDDGHVDSWSASGETPVVARSDRHDTDCLNLYMKYSEKRTVPTTVQGTGGNHSMATDPWHERAVAAGAGRIPMVRGRRWLVLMVVAGMLTGCAATDPTQSEASATGSAARPVDAGSRPAQHHTLTRNVLYKLLVGELATHAGNHDLSLASYMDAARETRDAAVAARTVKLAMIANAHEEALEAARLWSEVDPSSPEAGQALVSLLIRAGDVDGAVKRLETMIETTTEPPGSGFHRASTLLAGQNDVAAATAAMMRLVHGHEDNPAAQFALARFLAGTGQREEASSAIRHASELDPHDERIAIFRARLHQGENDVEGALAVLSEFLQRTPEANGVRMALARALVDLKRYEEARIEFERVVSAAPENDDARFAFALLLIQTNRLDEAVKHLEAVASGGARRDAAHFYLARIAEGRQRLNDAIAFYKRVRNGEHRLNAQIRAAVLMADGDNLDSALNHLRRVRARNVSEAVRIHVAEAGLLTRAERYHDAMDVFDASLERFPGNTDLLYARGMLAERIDRLDILERDMRDILAREPDHADALNALGYTLADRTDRFEEAYVLIKRALELKPDVSYIIDSMGWILYRIGRYQEALAQLRRAFSLDPDPEIAAHLGEVLWVLGQKTEAREVWSNALEAAPDDKRILEVIERFGL